MVEAAYSSAIRGVWRGPGWNKLLYESRILGELPNCEPMEFACLGFSRWALAAVPGLHCKMGRAAAAATLGNMEGSGSRGGRLPPTILRRRRRSPPPPAHPGVPALGL